MKKVWLFLIVLLTILIVNSCSETQKNPTEKSQDSEEYKVDTKKTPTEDSEDSEEYKVDTKNLKLPKDKNNIQIGSFVTSDVMINENQKHEKIICNTTMSTVSKNCDTMYNIYRAEYDYVTNVSYPIGRMDLGTCIERTKPIYRQLKGKVEEKCDNELIEFIMRNTQKLGCMQVLNREEFLYKKEYCRKHIRH